MSARSLTIPNVLAAHARHRPDKVAIIDDDGDTSFACLWERSLRARDGLEEAGIRQGDCVAVSMAPGARQLEVLLGAQLAGAVACPLNPGATDDERTRYLDRLGEPWLVTDRTTTTRAAREIDAEGLLERSGARHGPEPSIGPDAVSFAFPTGGTTGAPKAAAWTHRSVALAVLTTCAALGVTDSDVELYGSPFFHVTLITGLLATLYSGGTVIVPARFDPAQAGALLADGSVTRMFATPTVLERILRGRPRPAAFARPAITYGASPTDSHLPQRILAAFPNASIYSGYGSTESGAVTRLYPSDVGADGRGVGRALPGVEIKILDEAGHDIAARHEIGEVAVGTPWGMSHYLGADGDARTIYDGYIRPGDLGRIDHTGHLHLVARVGDVIKTGGEKVFPTEVEDVLRRHPLVEDAAVYGVPDTEWGQRVEAAIVGAATEAPDPEVLRSFCRASLAGFKVPKAFHRVERLPLTANMKVDRAALGRIGRHA